MKILITGAKGQLGVAVKSAIDRLVPDAEVIACGHEALDITSAIDVGNLLDESAVTHIINCAAYTAVDAAESDVDSCMRINAESPAIIGQEACRRGVRIVHISTDYVFDGRATSPIPVDATTAPGTVYGQSKLIGERNLMDATDGDAIIIRTSWLYSAAGRNFVKTMLRLGAERDTLSVVNDQFGSPTYAPHLAEAIATILSSGRFAPGIYHYADSGTATWFELASAALRLAGLDTTVLPVTTADYPTAASRPVYSVLDTSLILSTWPEVSIHPWEEGLKKCVNIIKRRT